MIVVKHVDSIFGSLLPVRVSTFKFVFHLNYFYHVIIAISMSSIQCLNLKLYSLLYCRSYLTFIESFESSINLTLDSLYISEKDEKTTAAEQKVLDRRKASKK